MDLDAETVRAMLSQALAEARSRAAGRVTALHLILYDSSRETEYAIRCAVTRLSANTPAANARVFTRLAPSKFLCWNCCGLRFESDDPRATCPNCGEPGLWVPPDVLFALERVEVEHGERV